MTSLKLLVVEDDLASLELMNEVLSSLKAEVRPVHDSQVAATLVGQERFDGIFLDLEMPHIDGFELARRIRTSLPNKSTPIIIVTGREERHTMREAFALGATYFLQKPVDRQRVTGLYRTVRGSLFENRRRHIRVPFQTEVTIEIASRTERAKTWNLSQSGIQIEAKDLQPGNKVRLSFALHGLAVIDASGIVVWAKETRQGIHFTRMSEQSEEAIRQFIAGIEKPNWLS